MRRLNVSPTPVRMKLMRTSLSVRAKPTNLSYFSHTTGIESMNAERSMLAMETNKANPVRPAYLNHGECDCVRQNHEKETHKVQHPTSPEN